MPARGQYRVHRAKGRRVEYDETSRYEHGGHIESAKKLARQFAEGSSALAYALSSNAKNSGVWPRCAARADSTAKT
jgi:hypothetical protein